jgi:hypothetical protein
MLHGTIVESVEQKTGLFVLKTVFSMARDFVGTATENEHGECQLLENV